MYIDSIFIENIRCFRGGYVASFGRGDGSYAGWTVLAGRNGTGKTSFLRSIVISLFSDYVYNFIRFMYGFVSKGSPEGRIDVRSSSGLNSGISFFVREGFPLVKSRGFNNFSVESEILLLGYGTRLSAASPTGNSDEEGDPRSLVGSLMFENFGLWDSLQWLQHLQFRAIEGHADAAQLRDDVIALLNDGLLPDKSRIEKVNSDGVWIVRDGVELPLELASDGYRAMIALIVDMAHKLSVRFKGLDLQRDARGHVSCPHPAVVLIDEIDAHLHVEWQQRIGFWLKRHFPKIQFIVTTHSPFVCQAADRRGIIRLPAPGEDRTIEHVSEETWKTLVRGGIDQAVMTDLFGLGHPHSDETEALQDELADLQSKALRGDDLTPEEEARAEELMGQLSGDLTTQVDVAMKAVGVRHAED